MPALLQGIGCHRTARVLQGQGKVSSRLRESDQLFESLQEEIGEPLLLGSDPLFVVARQQWSLIVLDGIREELLPAGDTPGLGGRAEEGLEVGYVGCNGCRIEPHREPI